MANPVEKIVDGTYVINLAHRTDRWESVVKALAGIGYEKYERFEAYGVNHLPPSHYTASLNGFKMSGWYGNKFSHYGVIERAKQDGLKSVMVFEDDVTFHPYFNRIVTRALEQIDVMTSIEAMKWDWLQFGGNHRFFDGFTVPNSPIDGMPYVYTLNGLKPETPNLARILKMLTAHAYIVKDTVYDFILKYAIDSPLSIDGFYGYEVNPRFRCYCVTPCVARQAPGVNDIGGEFVDNTWYIGD